jgi:hypothetical protein
MLSVVSGSQRATLGGVLLVIERGEGGDIEKVIGSDVFDVVDDEFERSSRRGRRQPSDGSATIGSPSATQDCSIWFPRRRTAAASAGVR